MTDFMPAAGTVFGWVFLLLAPSFALALVVRFVRRAIREHRRRWAVVAVGICASAIWIAASWAMFFLVFGLAWSLAHRRPFPSGQFPEGWPIYALLAIYTALGFGLLAAVGKVPRPAV